MTYLEAGEPRNEKVNDLFSVPDIIGVIKKDEMGTDLYKFLQKYRAL
jgi:hypothetical protein